MEKKLEARIQKLTKSLSQTAREFSSTLTVESEEEGLVEKKGVVYCVYGVKSEIDIDPLLITKVIHDVLYDSYYGSESVSPIQALEKAIVNVRDKITHLPGLDDSAGDVIKDFNLLAVVFWGNVLYMAQFGRGGSYLVRDGVVKPVNSATEGSFSVASGVVKEADVVILGTEDFIKTYTPEDLISGQVSFSMHDLEDSATALLLKFEAVEEVIPFGEEKDDRPASTAELAKKPPSELPKINLTRVKKKTNPPLIVGGAAVALLVLSIALSLRNNNATDSLEPESLEEVQSAQDAAEIPDVSRDEELKITRIDPAVFYDIKLVNSDAEPGDIVVLDSEVVVSDRSAGRLYSSSLTTSQFEEIGVYSGIRNIGYFGGDLVFTDSEGYKVLSDGVVSESYAGTVSGPAAPYLAFLYEANGGELIKHSLGEEGLAPEVWATSEEFNSPTSIAVDGNIYVLNSGGLSRWYAGNKATFEVSGLETSLSGAIKVVKSFDLGNIYVADSGNQRVLILDAEGNLANQIHALNNKFDDIRSISVSPDETKLFVLNGSKVYEIGL